MKLSRKKSLSRSRIGHCNDVLSWKNNSLDFLWFCDLYYYGNAWHDIFNAAYFANNW